MNGHCIIKTLCLAAVMLFGTACVTFGDAKAVEFELVDENNGRALYSSEAHMGVPIVLEFYFNGCPACESNAANVKRLAEEYHGTGAQIVEVSIDDDASDYEDWIQRHEPSWPVLNDGARQLARDQGVSSYPTTIVLDSAHRVVYRTIGVWSQATYARIARLISSR